MREERIELGQRERDRLKVLHEVEQRHLTQRAAGERLRLSERQIRRLLVRVRQRGDGGIVHGLRGQRSNRKLASAFEQRVMRRVRQRYVDFGPTLASETLAQDGLAVSRETLRKWMAAAGLWRPRRQRAGAVHVWRERRAAFGELVLWDSSPYAWLEDRGPASHLILMIDDAASRIWGRFAEHDSTEENFRVLQGWLERHGRPLAYYTDRDSLFVNNHPPQVDEQLRDERPRTQIGRALRELDIEWIAAHSPQAKGRIENAFGTLQDRLVKEMRLAGIRTLVQANDFFDLVFVPFWERRFAVAPRSPHNAHRRLGREHRLKEILSVRLARTVANDHTVSWNGERWGLAAEQVRAGMRGTQVEIERRLDGSHWLRFRNHYLPLHPCPAAPRSASPSGLRPPGLADRKPKPPTNSKPQYSPPPDHPWRKPWKRTLLLCTKPDISTLR
jgi:hypothetical protein